MPVQGSERRPPEGEILDNISASNATEHRAYLDISVVDSPSSYALANDEIAPHAPMTTTTCYDKAYLGGPGSLEALWLLIELLFRDVNGWFA